MAKRPPQMQLVVTPYPSITMRLEITGHITRPITVHRVERPTPREISSQERLAEQLAVILGRWECQLERDRIANEKEEEKAQAMDPRAIRLANLSNCR